MPNPNPTQSKGKPTEKEKRQPNTSSEEAPEQKGILPENSNFRRGMGCGG